MSMVVPQSREPVEATPRGPMTKARRLRLWLAHDGRCGECKTKVPLDGTTMDHAIQLWLSGEDEDRNLRPLCPACDKPKTARDATIRAKIKRIKAREDGTRKPRQPIPQRANPWPPKGSQKFNRARPEQTASKGSRDGQ